jgi:hypothetical protein
MAPASPLVSNGLHCRSQCTRFAGRLKMARSALASSRDASQCVAGRGAVFAVQLIDARSDALALEALRPHCRFDCCTLERERCGPCDYAKGCARVSLGPLRPSRTVIALPGSRYGMRHATSSHPPKFGFGTAQSAQGSHRFQASAHRPAPAYDPSSRCTLAGSDKPSPLGSDEDLPSTFRGNAAAHNHPCGGVGQPRDLHALRISAAVRRRWNV